MPGTAKYTMADCNDWAKISAENLGRRIDLIPYTGLNEFVGVNMCDYEMERMKDLYGDILYHKHFEWMLPTFSNTGESFWDFVVVRMQSYMTHLMIKAWARQWFNPNNGTIILLNPVA